MFQHHDLFQQIPIWDPASTIQDPASVGIAPDLAADAITETDIVGATGPTATAETGVEAVPDIHSDLQGHDLLRHH